MCMTFLMNLLNINQCVASLISSPTPTRTMNGTKYSPPLFRDPEKAYAVPQSEEVRNFGMSSSWLTSLGPFFLCKQWCGLQSRLRVPRRLPPRSMEQVDLLTVDCCVKRRWTQWRISPIMQLDHGASAEISTIALQPLVKQEYYDAAYQNLLHPLV